MVSAGQPLEPALSATTASRTLGRPATADQDERTEPVRITANDEVGSGQRNARPGSPLRIPLSLLCWLLGASAEQREGLISSITSSYEYLCWLLGISVLK